MLEAVREGNFEEEATTVKARITEAMRTRPVAPMTGWQVVVPWRFGPYGVPAGRPFAISILLLHYREDVYPDPSASRSEPERSQRRNLTMISARGGRSC